RSRITYMRSILPQSPGRPCRAARAPAHQPTATRRYCGLPCEMNDDWLATSSYGKPYASRLMAWSCQNLA
ncbi:MAG TPA: hypothetical protein VGP91_10805, partial [Actinoplanes sp.]|nr:hypothetical protein [Actinoplanes sp.]